MKAKAKYGSVYPAATPQRADPPSARRQSQQPAEPRSPVAAEALPLPHERDESLDQAGGALPSERVKQAGRDIKRGLVDTDRGELMRQTYEKQKR
jgi:hypothetical protein